MITINDDGQLISQIFGLTNSQGYVIPPTPINAYSMLGIPAYSRAVSFLADNMASFPRSVRRDGVRYDPNTPPHPLTSLLKRRPNGYQNGALFWTTLFFHAAHRWNGYAHIERSGATLRPVALHNLSPDDVVPFRINLNDGRGWQQWYAVYAPRTDKTPRILPGIDVIHITRCAYDGMAGVDPALVHRQTMQKAATLDKYSLRYLQRGTRITGSVEFPSIVPKERLDPIKLLIKQHYSGPEAESEPLLLTEGAKLNNSTISPHDSKLMEMGQLSTEQIAQIMGVPPQFLYDLSKSKYVNNVEAAGQDVVRYTFRPWITQIEDELTIKLLTAREEAEGFGVTLNPDALLRGDTATQSENVRLEVAGGIRTQNEGRGLLGLPRIDNPEYDTLRVVGDTTPRTNRNNGTGGGQGDGVNSEETDK